MNITLKPSWSIFGKGVNSMSPLPDSYCRNITKGFLLDLYADIDRPNGVYSFTRSWRDNMEKHEKSLRMELFNKFFKPTPGAPTKEQLEEAKQQEWWKYVYTNCGADMAKRIAKLNINNDKKAEIVKRFVGVVKNFRGYVWELVIEAGVKAGEFLDYLSMDYEPCTENFQENIDGIGTTKLGTHKIGVQAKNWQVESVDRKVIQQLADELEKWQVDGTIPDTTTVAELNNDTWMYVISSGPVSYYGNVRGIPENREAEMNEILAKNYGKRIRVIGPDALDKIFATRNQTQREFFKDLADSI